MATDNRTEHSLFPDVTEHYEREPAEESAPPQAPPESPGVLESTSITNPAPEQDVPVDGTSVGALPPQVEPIVDSSLPDEFDQMPTWLVAPESPAPERKKREKREKREKGAKREKPEKAAKRGKPENVAKPAMPEQPEQPEKPEKAEKAETAKSEQPQEPEQSEKREGATSGGRRPLLIGGVAVALIAIASAATVIVIGGGDTATEGTPKPAAVAAATTSATSTTSTAPEAAAPAWCADSTADGRSVGRGPGGTSDGPGVIRAFDHAYYVERSGARVASLMVAPNAVPEIQKFIDGVPLGSEHCVTIASTPDPNVFNVDLLLRTPGASEGVIRQRITVAPSPEGFKIAKVEDTQ
ncbi:hypothetical protein [Prescottella agglutinans]|uniref:DUF8176 domain-containing protein n=1 Tax=Prescottella agglutinans TaxID=1644129 RepID=A0ABT6MJF4_9NOCA|nr:hypothetical protein [Prescottella agglutinans]MDH6284447.1 hypothetical protein [Prescottella agglutinans]